MAEPQLQETEENILQCLSNANNARTQNLDMKSILLIAPQFLAPLLEGFFAAFGSISECFLSPVLVVEHSGSSAACIFSPKPNLCAASQQ